MGHESRWYSVVPYRDEWPGAFESEAALIRKTLGENLIYLEHVGGTSVPGLCSRPTIDMVAIVRDLGIIDAFVLALKMIGYERSFDESVPPHARFFVKEKKHDDGVYERLASLYICLEEHGPMLSMIDLRDYLKEHPEELQHLCDFKAHSSKGHPNDYWAYREMKEPVFRSLAKKAAKWRKRLPHDYDI